MIDSDPQVYPGSETREETTRRVNDFFRDSEIVLVRGVGDEPGQETLEFTRKSEALTDKARQEKMAATDDEGSDV